VRVRAAEFVIEEQRCRRGEWLLGKGTGEQQGLRVGGVGFEFAQAGILVLRFEDSDHVLSAFAPTAWTSVSGTALGDRGRRSSSGR
jgi:hypothetical protein